MSHRTAAASVQIVRPPSSSRFCLFTLESKDDDSEPPLDTKYTHDDIALFWSSSLRPAAILLIENVDNVWRDRLSRDDIHPTAVPPSFWSLHAYGLTAGARWEMFVEGDEKLRESNMRSTTGTLEYGFGQLAADPNYPDWQRTVEYSSRYGLTSATRLTYGLFGHMCKHILSEDHVESVHTNSSRCYTCGRRQSHRPSSDGGGAVSGPSVTVTSTTCNAISPGDRYKERRDFTTIVHGRQQFAL